MTKINVAMGPKIKDNKNQFSPDLFFPWASPAFISANVPQPTKYPSFIQSSPYTHKKTAIYYDTLIFSLKLNDILDH